MTAPEGAMAYRLNITTMLTIHDAFRRDLVEITSATARHVEDGNWRLDAQVGWQHFATFLAVHHRAEDDVLWPVLRAHLAEYPDHLTLVDDLETEHSAIDPLIAAIDEVQAEMSEDRPRLSALLGELDAQLTIHLAHEESYGLALIDEFLTLEEWQRFAQVHGQRLIGDAPAYVPWLLDQASPASIESFLSNIPPPLAAGYRGRWAAEYAALELWDAPASLPAHAQSD
jgi:iron-sulfur cluster repair protein YtfE (RIC family)